MDVEPSFGYTRRENPNLVLFTNRRNEYTGLLNVRIGLPWESQITVGASYLGVGAQTVNDFVAPTQQVSSRFGSSFGDLTIALSKTLLHQSGWLPDLIAGITYEAPTGPQVTNGVALSGSGQSRLGFALTALKRQDPLAFVASVGYNKAFVHDNLNPGDQLNFTGGVFLATSPETSLSAVLQQSFGQAPVLNGVTVTGANSVQSFWCWVHPRYWARGSWSICRRASALPGTHQSIPSYCRSRSDSHCKVASIHLASKRVSGLSSTFLNSSCEA